MLIDRALADPPRFQERAIRTVTVLVHAGIEQSGRDGLCRIRNVSEGGLTVETSLGLAVEQPAEVVLHTGDALDCNIRWTAERRAGMSCTTDPREKVYTSRSKDVGPTLPRFSRTMEIEIAVLGVPYRCVMDSISVRDVLVTELAAELRTGQLISIEIDGLGALPASVQIFEDGELYARFAPSLSFATLDRWLTREDV